MKTITFYSYKGGVGRSLALSNIAIRLSELRKKVCVLDFDLEAPGLQFKFNNYNPSKEIEQGIVDYIDEFTTKQTIPKSIKDFSLDLRPPTNLFEKIQLIPAGNIDNPLYWKKLSCINWASMFYEEESKGVEFFLDLKRKIETELQPDFLLIDSRTGITDIAGITLKLLADEAVILAANNQENLYGSKKIIKSLVDADNSLFGKPPKITFILTRLPYTDTAKDKEKEFAIVKRRTLEFQKEIPNIKLDILVIHSDRRLEENETHLIGDDYEAKTVSISNDYLKIFDALTSDVLSANDIEIFMNKKLAEKEFNNGMAEEDLAKKLIHFNKAVGLDDTKYNYFFERGKAYNKLNNAENAKADLEMALSLNPDSTEILNYIGWYFSFNIDTTQALEYIEKSILLNKDNWWSKYVKSFILTQMEDYPSAIKILNDLIDNLKIENANLFNSRADALRSIGNYEKAYEDIYKAIEMNPDVAMYFATLAEIYASEGKINEFYLNISIALSKGITAKGLKSAKDVYKSFKDEERFNTLMAKYSIDANEIFSEEQ